MKKIIPIIVCVFLVVVIAFLVLKSNPGLNIFRNSPPTSLKGTVQAITQKDKRLYLEVYSQDLNLKRRIFLEKVDTDMTIPTMSYKINDEQLLISIGNYEGRLIKIYKYNAPKGKVEYYGEIAASNPNILIEGNRIFSYRVEITDVGKYWIDEYDLADLSKRVKSIKIPDSPKKIAYSKSNNSLYLLFVGGTPTSSIGMYSYDKDSITVRELDEKSFAGDLQIYDDKVYVSMLGYSKDGKGTIEDARVLVLDNKLEQERVIKTSKSPNLIQVNESEIYVTVGKQGVAVDKIDIKSGEIQNNFVINTLGTPSATKLINKYLFILDQDNLNSIDSNGQILKKELSGRTLSTW